MKSGEIAAVTDDLPPGLYEELVSVPLASRLTSTDDRLVERISLRPADAADRIGQHLARELMRAIDGVPEADRVTTSIEVARRLIAEISERLPRLGPAGSVPADPAGVLTAVGEWRPDGSVRMPGRPLILLLDTSGHNAVTNAPGEPRLGNKILTEIESADSIDLVMAFVRRSGLLPFVAALRAHCERGWRLRVHTTTYTGSTEAKAPDLLVELGVDVRISYDVVTTRLHARVWFHRRTAYAATASRSSSSTCLS